MENMHHWKKQARGFGKRVSIGFAASLSFTLIAFEWTTYRSLTVLPPFDPTELPWEAPPIHPIKPEPKKEIRKETVRKKDASGPVKAVDNPVTDPDPATHPVPETDPIGPSVGTSIDTSASEAAGMTMPFLNPEILPYFDDCARADLDRTKECTELRIRRHLERHLNIPDDLKGTVRTTLTFEIDVQGSIGRIHCAPKVDPAIEEEIERVIRKLPQFIPGSQGGHAVAVYYQIPLLLTRN